MSNWECALKILRHSPAVGARELGVEWLAGIESASSGSNPSHGAALDWI